MNVHLNIKTPFVRSTKHALSKRILFATAVTAEQEAVLSGCNNMGIHHVDVLVAGVGPTEAAATTAIALTQKQYDLVICAGIGGGFTNKAPVGTLAISDEIIAADLGAETLDGFCPIDELGFGSNRISVEPQLVNQMMSILQSEGFPVSQGAILTLSTVTGTANTAELLSKRLPTATAEGMEGFGVATAARIYGLPVIEIRAISNAVGPRDRAAWRIPEALQLLTNMTAHLVKELSIQ